MPDTTTGGAFMRRLRLTVLGAALAACGEPAPGDPVPAGGLAISVDVARIEGPALSVSDSLRPVIACQAWLDASAFGLGQATWGDAMLYWFAGKNRDLPLDSVLIPASDIQASWGGPTMAAGESRQAGWSFEAGVPFAVRFTFRYGDPDGPTGRTSAGFTCGPEIPPDALPPEIPEVSVQTPSGVLEPGDTLVVQYRATSAVGLWETAVLLSGACSSTLIFADLLAPTVSRSVTVPIPAGCSLGVPLTVAAAAVDAALQDRLRPAPTSLVLSDVTPPRIAPLFFPPWGVATETLDADYFVGDSVDLYFGAEDNHQVRWLIWEVLPAGLRDSLAVSGPVAGPRVKLEVRPEWLGSIQLAFTARDAVGLTSAAVTTEPGAVTVYRTVERPSASAVVAGEIREVVIDQPRGVLYLLQPNESRLTVLNTATLAVVRTVDTPGGPVDFDITPSGDSLLLSLQGVRALGVINLRQAEPSMAVRALTSLDTALAQGPAHIRATANSRAFVRLGGNSVQALRLLELDLTTGTETLRADVGDAGYIGGGTLERSHDFSALVLQGGPQLLQRYEAGTNTFGARSSAVPYDIRPLLDGAGQVVAIGLDLYDATLQFQRRIQSIVTIGGTVPAALAPTDGYLYHALRPWGILRSRVSDGRLVDRTRTGLTPSLLRIAPDGSLLVVVESNYGPTSRISTIDLR